VSQAVLARTLECPELVKCTRHPQQELLNGSEAPVQQPLLSEDRWELQEEDEPCLQDSGSRRNPGEAIK
jgi:hypothetical protein